MELSALCKQYHFTLTRIRPIPGSSAQLVEMIYGKTATEVCWVRNGESNMLFGIAFKTIPTDDTGVFHILEHSVLCGSDKYPVKEPFVELLKSSMNTFLNALTYPDKTVYPVSSRNQQDFLNLTGVYLDAVFAPAILHEPNIFRQEGWHYEPDGENLTYNGVVFNEMKGAMSSVDETAERSIRSLLFPDNCYRYNSGGDPSAIPNLTYQQFLDTYKKNYHPTNARIYLDGDIPVEKTLSMLDEYLGRYEMGEKQQLEKQIPVSREKSVTYETANDGTPKAQLVLGKILGDFGGKTELLARQVLCDVIAGSNDAPLKRAVLSTGLCRNLTMRISSGMLQPFMVLRLHNMEDENAARLEETIRTCARELIANGIPKERLTASINRLAFHVRQMHEPQALTRIQNCMNSWLYGGDPMLYLHYGDSIDALRAMVERDEFEALLEEMLLNTDGLCKLHVLPSEEHGANLRKAESARLAAEKAAMSETQLQEIATAYEAFTAWQQTPDSPEGLATLPKLNLSEISPEPVLYATEEDCVDGVTLLRHKVASNGIAYLCACFRLTACTLEQLTQVSLLGNLLGKLPTAAHSSAELQNEVKTWLGGLSFGVEIVAKSDRREVCTPMLRVYCSVLQENLGKAEQLIHEILTSTDFSQSDRIREILLQTETEAQRRGMMGGHTLAIKSVSAHYSAAAAAQEAISGITCIRFLHDLSKNFDARIEGFVSLLQRTLKKAVCRKNLILSLTEDGSSDLSGFVARFPEGEAAVNAVAYETRLPKKLGIRIPAQVSFASVGYHLGEAGIAYDGTARLLSNVLSLAHLWNEVRVQGGAYGAGMYINKNSGLVTQSYRDPDPARSLEVYRNMGSFVRAFAESGEDITGFIISTVAETEPLVGPEQQGAMADNDWFAGIGYAEAAAERQQLLGATAADLIKWCDVLDALRDKAAVCVVGYADALDSCKDENLTILDI